MPTDAYSLEAVRDDFLVPPQAVSVPVKFQREGIKYDELSEEDKDQWDALTRGLKVAGGDRLGKTIIFAKNQQHADFIAERFNTNY